MRPPLDPDRGQKRPTTAPESDHECVADRLHVEAATLRDLLADDRVVLPPQGEPLQISELLRQRRRALDVGEQQRDGPVGRNTRLQIHTFPPDGVRDRFEVGGEGLSDGLRPIGDRQVHLDHQPSAVAALEHRRHAMWQVERLPIHGDAHDDVARGPRDGAG